MGQSADSHPEIARLGDIIAPLPRAFLEDRLSMIVHQAHGLEYALLGAPLDNTPREALLGLAMSLSDKLGELLSEIEGKEVEQ